MEGETNQEGKFVQGQKREKGRLDFQSWELPSWDGELGGVEQQKRRNDERERIRQTEKGRNFGLESKQVTTHLSSKKPFNKQLVYIYSIIISI